MEVIRSSEQSMSYSIFGTVTIFVLQINSYLWQLLEFKRYFPHRDYLIRVFAIVNFTLYMESIVT